MPDVTISVKNLKDDGDAERLERALSRLDAVSLANVDSNKGLVAVSYEGGGESGLKEIEATIEEAGFEYEATPGARKLEDG